MPVSIDSGFASSISVPLVYEQPAITVGMSDGGSVVINALPAIPVELVILVDLRSTVSVAAIGAVTQARTLAIGSQVVTDFAAATVKARSIHLSASADLNAIGFIQAANVEARDIRLTPAATLDARATHVQAREFAATGQATLEATAGATQGRFIALETAATVQPFITGAAVAAREIRFTPSAAVNVTGGQIEARHALIAAGAVTSFVGEDGAVHIITVVNGGVQPEAQPLVNGDRATDGIPIGADTLANYETSAVGESITNVVVTVKINGTDRGVISEQAA